MKQNQSPWDISGEELRCYLSQDSCGMYFQVKPLAKQFFYGKQFSHTEDYTQKSRQEAQVEIVNLKNKK